MTAHIVATAIRDNVTGRIWSAVGGVHGTLRERALADLGLPEPRPERLENSPKVRFASGFLTDAGQFLTSQEGYGTVFHSLEMASCIRSTRNDVRRGCAVTRGH
jgi:hypothetical protein